MNVAERVALADKEVENYDFGQGVQFLDQGAWCTDDPADLTKMVYVEYDSDPQDAEEHALSFHVRFGADGKVSEAYALAMKGGGEVGTRGTVAA